MESSSIWRRRSGSIGAGRCCRKVSPPRTWRNLKGFSVPNALKPGEGSLTRRANALPALERKRNSRAQQVCAPTCGKEIRSRTPKLLLQAVSQTCGQADLRPKAEFGCGALGGAERMLD